MQLSVAAITDRSKLRSKNHNELAVLKQPLNVTPIICGHLVVSILCPSNYVWFSYGMPNGTSKGNQYLGSTSRSVGDILYPKFLQHVGSWPFYIMTFTLLRGSQLALSVGTALLGKGSMHMYTQTGKEIHTPTGIHMENQTHVCTTTNTHLKLCLDMFIVVHWHFWGPSFT